MKHSPQCTGFESPLGLDRRGFLQRFGGGLGGIALANMLHGETGDGLHHPAKAKRVIYLFQSGGPSQIDLFDHKPKLTEETGKELPDSVRQGQRLTGMSGNQASLPLVGSPFKFAQHGKSGHWISDRLPHTAKIADDLCIVKSMYTEAINHGPGVTFMQTGSQFPGRPSMGAWLSHGLGTMNRNLPNFVTLVTKGKGGQPLVSRLWGSGFLPGKHAGTRFRPDKDAILYLNSPKGVTSEGRRKMLDRLKDLHELQLERTGDPRLETRIAQYEMGYRMQSSIPEVTDLGKEPESTFKLYGEDARKPGTFAANCLLARRLAEQDVRFIQLYHPGWDQHGGLPGGISRQCKETDQASAALVTDLKARGMLEDTLVIWGGEFGRTNYCQGKFNA
ncbi:MAG: DUF1501 domain-containing protein, partial [Opitutales bacterium]|nr:DUF1501 domain-containing protein [Opitutales bacterium]